MPITQNRLISLIEIYATQRERNKQLVNQTAAIYHSITTAYHNKDLEEVIGLVQALIREIEHCTKVRESEYDIYSAEKGHFERKAKANENNKLAMREARKANGQPRSRRRKYLDDGLETEQEFLRKKAKVLAQVMDIIRESPYAGFTSGYISRRLEIEENYILQTILPTLEDRGKISHVGEDKYMPVI